jgi:hypothetical protein
MHVDRQRTLLATAVAVFAALALSPGASAAGGISGTYTTTVKSPAQLKGRWVLTLAPGGSYTVAWNGQAVARGRHTSTAKTITLDREQGSGCSGAGTYAWKRSGQTVSFTKKRESGSCQARAVVLSHRFTQR